ncbi:hypothetical protein [Rhodococcus triatomae]|nr:hypothetical protein [Rhodococcus triatomae]
MTVAGLTDGRDGDGSGRGRVLGDALVLGVVDVVHAIGRPGLTS